MVLKLALIVLCAVAVCSGKTIESSPFKNELFPYPRIIGGAVAEEGERPDIVAIRTGFFARSFVCGGSLITPRAALTAAHCNDAVRGALRVWISVGHNSHNNGREYRCQAVLNHPEWNVYTTKSDVGILFTAVAVELTPLVSTIALHQPALTGGEDVEFYGWGTAVTGGSASAVLKKLSTTVQSHEQCVALRNAAQEAFPYVLPLIDEVVEVCTFHSRGNGACHGDSGSPLVIKGTNQQVGLVSWGVPCAIGGPDVFARIGSFIGWVESNKNNI